MSTQTSDATVPEFELRHRLARALEAAGLKPEDMAEEIGRGVTTVRNYLGGRTIPSRAVITTWAWRCRVDPEWLRTGETHNGPGDPGGQEILRSGCDGEILPFRARRIDAPAVAHYSHQIAS